MPVYRSGSSKEANGLSVQSRHAIQPFSGSLQIKSRLFIALVSMNTSRLVPENKNISTHQREKNDTTNVALSG